MYKGLKVRKSMVCVYLGEGGQRAGGGGGKDGGGEGKRVPVVTPATKVLDLQLHPQRVLVFSRIPDYPGHRKVEWGWEKIVVILLFCFS